MDTLKDFLTSEPTDDWKWLNNDACFTHIEKRYKAASKNIKVTSEDECAKCDLKDCIAVRLNGSPLKIDNNGKTYRLCKPDILQQAKEQERQQRLFEEQRKKEREERMRIEAERRARERKERLCMEAEQRTYSGAYPFNIPGLQSAAGRAEKASF